MSSLLLAQEMKSVVKMNEVSDIKPTMLLLEANQERQEP